MNVQDKNYYVELLDKSISGIKKPLLNLYVSINTKITDFIIEVDNEVVDYETKLIKDNEIIYYVH